MIKVNGVDINVLQTKDKIEDLSNDIIKSDEVEEFLLFVLDGFYDLKESENIIHMDNMNMFFSCLKKHADELSIKIHSSYNDDSDEAYKPVSHTYHKFKNINIEIK